MPTLHQPVLYEEVIQALNLQPNQKVIDCTVGGGGHAFGILKAIGPHGKLMGFDADPKAITVTKDKLNNYSNRVILINSSFSKLQHYVDRYRFKPVAAILLDLGWSTDQLADTSRGFSFEKFGQLDLRFNSNAGQSARELLNNETVKQLTWIFKKFGDEPQAAAIARAVVKERQVNKFNTTDDLLRVVARVKGGKRGRLHPATKVWQALRIAVNQELEELQSVLPQAVSVLEPSGRLAVISFHSGEDSIVKDYFKKESKNCLCPPVLPVCRCEHRAQLKLINQKVIKPNLTEQTQNLASRSARLRIAEKI
ncbi:MAG: 16S rRNA (cytosine(1402)-N(4))-methyltransferase RsmH [Patescibacteria group bacterium]